MLSYSLRRTAQGLIVVLVVSFLTFIEAHLMPGSPAMLFRSAVSLIGGVSTTLWTALWTALWAGAVNATAGVRAASWTVVRPAMAFEPRSEICSVVRAAMAYVGRPDMPLLERATICCAESAASFLKWVGTS